MAMTQPLEDLYAVQPRILNHDIMHCTAEGVTGNYLYSGRALGMTTPQDIIQLHPELASEFDTIAAHYDRVGLSHTDQIIWNVDFAEVQQYPQYEASFFYFGDAQHRNAKNENWYRVVDFINSKNNFMDLAQKLGMPIPHTRCFASPLEVGEADIRQMTYPCYLKASISVSGVGIYRCETARELRIHLQSFAEDVPVQIQEEIRTQTFLNLQYQVTGSRLQRLAATEQILDGCVHQGNVYPTPYDAWGSVEPMAKWLFSQGMRGIFAFDVGVVEDHRGQRFVPIECNPRFNGASYPTLIAEKLGISQWQARAFTTRYRHLSDLPIQDLEYNPVDQSGIVLVNWGSVLEGKILLLIAGSEEQQWALQMELERRL